MTDSIVLIRGGDGLLDSFLLGDLVTENEIEVFVAVAGLSGPLTRSP